MTKKHFIALAAAIKDTPIPARLLPDDHADDATVAYEARRFAANVIAVVACADNPRFDYERFVKACGLSEGK